MTNPPHLNQASHVSPRRPDGSRGRFGRYIGPVRITPIRVVLVIALFGALAFIALAILTVKDTSQIPMVAAGSFVLALVFVAFSVGSAIRMLRAWQEGLQGETIVFALLGGIAGAIALGCLAGVLVLALVWKSA